MDSDVYGPPLPPGYRRDSYDEYSEEEGTSSKFNKSDQKKIIGPECPSGFLKDKESENDSALFDSNVPTLPVGFLKNMSPTSDSDSADAYGPTPLTSFTTHNDMDDIVTEVEKRAESMKRKLDGLDEVSVKKVEREEWMTVPNISSKNQLGAISRCLSDSKGHRTDSFKKDKHRHRSSKEEQKLSKELERYNKSKRSKSLLEIHHKSKKKKKNEDSKKSERKPFNRDEDMSLRLMNKDQVKSVIDKAKYLGSRFSCGQSKYL